MTRHLRPSLASLLPLLALTACADMPEADIVADSASEASRLDLGGAPPVAPVREAPEAAWAPTRFSVAFARGQKAPESLRIGGATVRAVRVLHLAGLDVGTYPAPAGLPAEQAALLAEATPGALWAEADVLYKPFSNDPYFPYQWNLDMIGAENAWIDGDGTGVVVAVVDSGVTEGTLDGLNAKLQGYDFADGDNNPADAEGHGTHVSGTIAQDTNNNKGVAGVAPGATILPVRVMGSAGGLSSDIAAGVDYAVAQGADVINMSLGGYTTSKVMAIAVAEAVQAGVAVVAASGNDGVSSRTYPAAYPGVFTVGAVHGGGTITAYSNTGAWLDIAAPGGDSTLDADGDGYADVIYQETFVLYGNQKVWDFWGFEGTSMAAPHVSAAFAVLISAGATPAEAAAALRASAVDKGTAGYDNKYGYGRLDLDAAVGLVGTNLDSTAPAITNLVQGTNVSFKTGEQAKGWICNGAFKVCKETSTGYQTSHAASRPSTAAWSTWWAVAEDRDGNTTIRGPL